MNLNLYQIGMNASALRASACTTHPCTHTILTVYVFFLSLFVVAKFIHSLSFSRNVRSPAEIPTFSLNLPANPLQLLVCLLAAVNCRLPNIANGRASTHLNTVSITCNAGFQLIGNDVVVCTGTEFRSPHGICIGMCYDVLHVLTDAFHVALRSELHVHASFSC